MASKRTVLLLGANGQVGHELVRTLPAIGRVIALDYPDIDFGNPGSLRALVRETAPQVIVNAAAYTAVDKAESEPALAQAINADAPAILAEEAADLGATVVHYSTDYVFDGTKAGPYVEADRTDPLSVYGKTKLAGENAIAKCPRHLTFRTSWVISAHGNNFVKTMLRLAKERDSLRVVADQWGAPTSAALLAETTTSVLASMRNAASDDTRWGLYHLVAGGETTWNGLARRVLEKASELGEVLKTAPNSVASIMTAEYPTLAKRPMNSRLSTAKLFAAFQVQLPNWEVGVNAAVRQLVGG